MSGGARRLRESSLFPRRDYWDTFAKSTSAFTLHWEDVPAFADFALPDEVHLDYRDAPRFTRLLADELCARGALRPRP